MQECENVKIVVAAHKKCRLPKDELYIPVQVGCAGGKLDLKLQRDDEGDNISAKNPNYCELTALYWAWKNLKADYIGMSHYRRFFCLKRKKEKFESIINYQQCIKLLQSYDVIVPRKRNYFIETNETQYLHAHHPEGWEQMCRIIERDYPEYAAALFVMRHSTKGHRFNMFIMKKEYLNQYCSWLFDILGKVEQEIDISDYSVNEARVFGYLSERLLDVWLDTKRIQYYELPVVFMEKQNWVKKGVNFLRRKFSRNK